MVIYGDDDDDDAAAGGNWGREYDTKGLLIAPTPR